MLTEQVGNAPTDACDERLVRINVQMARDAKLEQNERTRHSANRLASALGATASLLALYDLALLAGIGH